MAAKIGATTGTHEYPQSELPLCLSGSSAWRMRGPRSRAGFKAGPVGPPSEATKVATIDDPYDLENVLHLLVDNPFIPVVQDGYFTGIVTRREVMKGINNIGHNIDKNFQLEPLTVTVPKES